MMTGKKNCPPLVDQHFQLAQKYSKIQILMPQIPPLMIQKGIGFANLYNEGQVLAETLGS